MRLPGQLVRDQAGDLLRPPPGFATMAGAAGGVHRRGASYDYGRGATSYLLDGGVNWYVDSARPNNSGNGLTPATAKKNIWAVLNALPFPDVGPVNVWVKSGTYDLAGGWAGVTVLSRANFIATANLSTATLASWEPGAVTTTSKPASARVRVSRSLRPPGVTHKSRRVPVTRTRARARLFSGTRSADSAVSSSW